MSWKQSTKLLSERDFREVEVCVLVDFRDWRLQFDQMLHQFLSFTCIYILLGDKNFKISQKGACLLFRILQSPNLATFYLIVVTSVIVTAIGSPVFADNVFNRHQFSVTIKSFLVLVSKYRQPRKNCPNPIFLTDMIRPCKNIKSFRTVSVVVKLIPDAWVWNEKLTSSKTFFPTNRTHSSIHQITKKLPACWNLIFDFIRGVNWWLMELGGKWSGWKLHGDMYLKELQIQALCNDIKSCWGRHAPTIRNGS